MAIDTCLDSYGPLVQLLTTEHPDTWGSPLPSLRRGTTRSRTSHLERWADLDIRAVAARLPFIYLQVLWLVDTCGASYAETATIVGCSESEVARRVAHGRALLRAELDRSDPPERLPAALKRAR